MPQNDSMVHITTIGTGDGGLEKGAIGVTPSGQPNAVFNVIGPILAILIRAVHLFFTTLVSLTGAASTPVGNKIMPATDFMELLSNCAVLAMVVVIGGAIKDFATVFGKLEGKFPLLTGSV